MLIPFAIVAALLVQVVVLLFRLKNSEDLTAEDVATYLDDFVNCRGGDWDWDDFTSIPITDPTLERVRLQAASVPLPLTDKGRAVLRQLVAQVRALA